MYRAPVDEIAFTLKHVIGFKPALDDGRFGDLSEDLTDAVLAEAGRFAGEEVAPLARVGDVVGSRLADGVVATPQGWPDLYRRWREAGWNAVTGPQSYGGQGLPTMLGMATIEMWNGASLSFGIGPVLTAGAIEALESHATETLKTIYLGKLVSGEWMGTMNLTEPQAGSDLGALRTRAERSADGSYRIFGQKIYITYGDHDLTENIVHLVLARLPDAPPGTKGISLFLVPKRLVEEDGSLGRRNDLFCSKLEDKLGLHGSPTCVMIYGDGSVANAEAGAVGWLVGEENRGLACMFTMMNNARLAVGIQGVAVAEAATQKALAYAGERRQGRASTFTGEGMAPILHHPDIQRMLLSMQALTAMARALCYATAHALDMARAEPDAGAYWSERANLLTPMAKAFATDAGVEVASLGVQVHGGMGYIEETGAAVLYRDARILPIYEGTNGIQAIDLAIRKLPQSGGAHVRGYIRQLQTIAESVRDAGLPGMGDAAARLESALADLTSATEHILLRLGEGEQIDVLAGATPYLRLFGLAAGTVYLARGAVASGDPRRIALFRFAAENLAAEAASLKEQALRGGASVAAAGALMLEA